MIIGDQHREYKQHITRKLVELGLEPDQIKKVAPVLFAGIEFLEKEVPLNSPLFNYRERIDTAATLLGITFEQYKNAAVRQPQLFRVAPEKANENIERTAELLGIQKNVFIQSALQRPQLFYLDPETIAGHATLMHQIEDEGFVPRGVQKLYLGRPILLTLADDNFELRLEFARHTGIGQGDRAPNNMILTESRKRIQENFLLALGHDPKIKVIRLAEPTADELQTDIGQNHQKLIDCVRRGLFKGYRYEPHDSTPPTEDIVPA